MNGYAYWSSLSTAYDRGLENTLSEFGLDRAKLSGSSSNWLHDDLVASLVGLDLLSVLLDDGPRVVLSDIEIAVLGDDWVQAVERLEDGGLPGFVLADDACDIRNVEPIRVPDRLKIGDVYRLQLAWQPRLRGDRGELVGVSPCCPG